MHTTRLAPVLAALAFPLLATAQSAPAGLVLFDFESGIQEWWGNPWGGGECKVAPSADAKFGHGALACTYRARTSPQTPPGARSRGEP